MIRGFQPALGSTGDFTPWHGTPKDPKYSISDQQWVAYANDRTATSSGLRMPPTLRDGVAKVVGDERRRVAETTRSG